MGQRPAGLSVCMESPSADKPWRQQELLLWECVLLPLAQGTEVPAAPAKAVDRLWELAQTLTILLNISKTFQFAGYCAWFHHS